MRRTSLALLLGLASGLVAIAACVGDDPQTPASSQPPDGGPGATGADTGTTPQREDAGGGQLDAAQDPGPPRFCADKKPLTGFVDFLCADFDGPTLEEGFTTYVPDGGALQRVTEVHHSPPASFASTKNAQLVWDKAGGGNVAEIDLRFHVNVASVGGLVPAADGSVKILEAVATNARLELRYTRGGTVDGAAHTGYFISASYCPSACALVQKRLATPLQQDAWTEVHIAWTKAGLIQVAYNDIGILSFTANAFTATTTSLRLGVVAFADSPAIGRHAVDNVRFAVRRD